jgi:RNA polymerase sigma-70 factor (ECF subfamily)
VIERAGRADEIADKASPPLDLRALFQTHYASIWRLLRRLGVPPAQIDDATQEVFWVAARRLSDIQPGREHSFLYGVALRIAASDLRRQKSAMPLVEMGHVALVVDQGLSPEDQVADRQARELLDDALNRLPIELRTVLVLHEIEGLEVRQIAELEEIPVGTAGSRLRRARKEFSAIARRIRAGQTAQGWNR